MHAGLHKPIWYMTEIKLCFFQEHLKMNNDPFPSIMESHSPWYQFLLLEFFRVLIKQKPDLNGQIPTNSGFWKSRRKRKLDENQNKSDYAFTIQRNSAEIWIVSISVYISTIVRCLAIFLLYSILILFVYVSLMVFYLTALRFSRNKLSGRLPKELII